jgi:hypothetical protein
VTFAVIGGTVLDAALGPVVALATDDGAGPVVFCSGVVVGPAHVLTAGHCVDTADALVAAGAVASVRWGGDVAEEEAEVRGWLRAEVHPEVADPDHGHDLAVVTLDADAASAPAALAGGPPAVGDALAFYGYGASSEGGDDAGVLRGTHLEVLEVDDLVFRSFAAGTNVCSGDSGGPAVASAEDGWWVVGVDTFVDPTCLGGTAGTTRIDVHLEWLADLVGELVLDPIGPADPPRREERGCSTAPGGVPAIAIGALALLSRRRTTGAPSCGAKAAALTKVGDST